MYKFYFRICAVLAVSTAESCAIGQQYIHLMSDKEVA